MIEEVQLFGQTEQLNSYPGKESLTSIHAKTDAILQEIHLSTTCEAGNQPR